MTNPSPIITILDRLREFPPAQRAALPKLMEDIGALDPQQRDLAFQLADYMSGSGPVAPTPAKPGRPRGSRNKAKAAPVEPPRKVGDVWTEKSGQRFRMTPEGIEAVD